MEKTLPTVEEIEKPKIKKYIHSEKDVFTGDKFESMIKGFKKIYKGLIKIAKKLSKINIFLNFDLNNALLLIKDLEEPEVPTRADLRNAVCKKITIGYMEKILKCANERAKVYLFGRVHGDYFNVNETVWSRSAFMLVNYQTDSGEFTSVIIDLGSFNGVTCESLNANTMPNKNSYELRDLIERQINVIRDDHEDESAEPLSTASIGEIEDCFEEGIKKRYIKTDDRGLSTFFTHNATCVMIHLGNKPSCCPRKTKFFLHFNDNGVYESATVEFG